MTQCEELLARLDKHHEDIPATHTIFSDAAAAIRALEADRDYFKSMAEVQRKAREEAMRCLRDRLALALTPAPAAEREPNAAAPQDKGNSHSGNIPAVSPAPAAATAKTLKMDVADRISELLTDRRDDDYLQPFVAQAKLCEKYMQAKREALRLEGMEEAAKFLDAQFWAGAREIRAEIARRKAEGEETGGTS